MKYNETKGNEKSRIRGIGHCVFIYSRSRNQVLIKIEWTTSASTLMVVADLSD